MKVLIDKLIKKKIFLVLPLFFMLCIISSFYLVFTLLKLSNIERTLIYLVCSFIMILLLYLLLQSIIYIKKSKKIKALIFSLVLVMVFAIQSASYKFIDKIYNSINLMSNTKTTYSSSLIGLKDINIDNIIDIKGMKIGIIDDESNIDGHVIPKEIISEYLIDENNEIIEYESFYSLISDLYKKELDLVFVSSNYTTLFSSFEDFTTIKDDTKIIYTKTKDKNVDNVVKDINEPFTVLVMGVDSTLDNINSVTAFNGDALMLITFNPKTFNATILSIPRDTYVPITCFRGKVENKITHAAWYGESCMIDTIENFTGIDIDYHVKVNFKGLVGLVDALGGIELDVPFSFCEQNSNRQWGANTIYVEKGLRTINGEQALALARNRHPNPICGAKWTNYTSDDLVRGQNQQLVINALLNKVKDIDNINEINSILDVVKTSISTSITTDTMLSFFDIAKKMLLTKSNNNNDLVSFEHLFLDGHGQMIYDNGMGLVLWNYVYNRQSLNDIVKEMKINLSLEEKIMDKEMNFSINNTYTQVVIGKGPYKYENGPGTLPSFIDRDISYVTSWGINNNIKILVNQEETQDKTKNNIVLKQSLPQYYLMNNITKKELTITVGKYVEKETPTTIDCTKEENKEHSSCLIPDFTKYTEEQARVWKSKQSTSSIIDIKTEITLDESKYNTCYSSKSGKPIFDNKEIQIICYKKQSE